MPSWFDYICKEPLSHHRSRQTWVLEGHRWTPHSHLFALFIQTNEYQKLESPALAKYLNVWSIFSVPLFLLCTVVTCGLFYPFYIVHSSGWKMSSQPPHIDLAQTRKLGTFAEQMNEIRHREHSPKNVISVNGAEANSPPLLACWSHSRQLSCCEASKLPGSLPEGGTNKTGIRQPASGGQSGLMDAAPEDWVWLHSPSKDSQNRVLLIARAEKISSPTPLCRHGETGTQGGRALPKLTRIVGIQFSRLHSLVNLVLPASLVSLGPILNRG